jgi:hypothetical protein
MKSLVCGYGIGAVLALLLFVAGSSFAGLSAIVGGEDVTSQIAAQMPANFFSGTGGSWSGNAYDSTLTAVDVYSGGNKIATITGMTISFSKAGSPQVGLGFSVEAAANTTFDFAVTIPDIVPVTNPHALVSASYGVDSADADGATIAGLFGANMVYQARTNQLGTFNLAEGMTIGGFDSNGNAQDASGMISGTVSSLTAEYYFSLTSEDAANGTSTFIIPEPITIGLLALGTLVLARKR